MKTIIAVLVFCALAYGADLKDQAESIFDIDYIDFDRVFIMGTPKTGQVIVARLKNGDILTKTLTKSKQKDVVLDSEEWEYSNPDRMSIPDIEKECEEYTFDQSIAKLEEIVSSEWENRAIFDNGTHFYTEEIYILEILSEFEQRNLSAAEFTIAVDKLMDAIKTEKEHGSTYSIECGRLKRLTNNTEHEERVKNFIEEISQNN